jgi:hypothetical protein
MKYGGVEDNLVVLEHIEKESLNRGSRVQT